MTLRSFIVAMFWKEYDGDYLGYAASVIPDGGVPETAPEGFPKWLVGLRTLWLIFFKWKTCAVFRVPDCLAREGYHVAYKPRDAPAQMTVFRVKGAYFRMLTGYEPCGFFVVDRHGKAHALEVIAELALRDHLMHRSFPLY